jgi:hypothetical protein
MGGRQLYDEVRVLAPDLARRMIFATGDTLSPEAREFLVEGGRPCVGKPFHLEEMENLIESLFESAPASGPADRTTGPEAGRSIV